MGFNHEKVAEVGFWSPSVVWAKTVISLLKKRFAILAQVFNVAYVGSEGQS